MKFKYTADQEKIVNYLREQLTTGGSNVVVSGQGGTGKTAMLCQFISELLSEGYKVAATAMTGKATAVIRSKIWQAIRDNDIDFPKENLLIETVQKITKESKVLGLTESGDTIYTNTWRDPKTFAAKYDVLFVDELSMIPNYVAQWWQAGGIRVFGFGDHCQLPEVSTNETKKELAAFKHDLKVPTVKFTAGYGVKVLKTLAKQSLTKVLRSDNEIALLCNDLRDFKQPKTDVVKIIKDWAAKTDNIQYSTSIEDLETDNDWQIIAYTNKLCQEINNQLCIGENYPDLQDKIILFDNLNPMGLYNGDTIVFGDFLAKIAQNNIDPKKRKIFVCLKWQGKMPNKNTTNPIERQFFDNYVAFKRAIDNCNIRRLKSVEDVISTLGYSKTITDEWLKMVEEIKQQDLNAGDCFMQIVQWFYDNERDVGIAISEQTEKLPRLYMISADFGYAITTHRSQGSEYQNVCYLLERFDRPLLYTGISRAKEKVKIINLTDVK